MKIELISENQIRCTLTKEDLAARHIKISELAYGTSKARLLFREMIEKASVDYGFITEDIPLMIEAIPMSSEGIVLLISKVSEPDELDTRFSEFTAYDEDALDDSMISDMEEIQSSEENPLLDFFRRLYDRIEQGKLNDRISASVSQEVVMLTFDNMNSVIRMARDFREFYNGKNSLYRSPKGGLHLLMSVPKSSKEDYNNLCLLASEYGKLEFCLKGMEAHISEHYNKLIENNALQVLAAM